jgi:hypothetical protein
MHVVLKDPLGNQSLASMKPGFVTRFFSHSLFMARVLYRGKSSVVGCQSSVVLGEQLCVVMRKMVAR